MPDAEELEELRSLQARAYGRDAVLSDADADRLRELEDRRVARAAASAERDAADRAAADREKAHRENTEQENAGPDTTLTAEPHAVSALHHPREDDEDPPPDAEGRSGPRAVPLRSLLRSRWRPFAIAAVAVLVIGLGVGWLAFGRSAVAPVALSAEQQGWEDKLVAVGGYDAGSIRALAVEEGAVIWSATKDGRVRTCLILGTGDMTTPSCDRTERVAETGIYGSIMVRDADDAQLQVNAQMLLTAAGEPAVAVNSYDYEPSESGITYANETESQTAERLADAGFEPGSLWVVGYDGDVPVWTGMQLESQNRCLIYDGSSPDSPMTCADPETMQDQAASLVLNVTSVATGQVTHLEVAPNRGPGYLVITREGSVVGAGGD